MNTDFILANLSLIIFPIALTGVAFFLIILVMALIFKWPGAKKYGLVGLVVFALVGIVPLIDLIQRDWSVAECSDSKDNIKCQLP